MKSPDLIFYQHREIKAVPRAGLSYDKRTFAWRPKLSWWSGELKPLLEHFPKKNHYGVCARSCRRCEARYVPFGRLGHPVMFCSMKCRKADHNARRQVLRAEYRPSRAKRQQPIVCGQCFERFTPKRSDAKFCSGGCRVKAHLAKGAKT